MCKQIGLMFGPIFCEFCLKRGQSRMFAALEIIDHVLLMVIRLLLLLDDSG